MTLIMVMKPMLLMEILGLGIKLTNLQPHQRFHNPENILENASCKLLHYNGDGVIVAEGRIASTDLKAKIHHVTLGRSCWKVWVDKIVVKNMDLIRPNEEMSTLDDALDSTVAWWPKLIVLDD